VKLKTYFETEQNLLITFVVIAVRIASVLLLESNNVSFVIGVAFVPVTIRPESCGHQHSKPFQTTSIHTTTIPISIFAGKPISLPLDNDKFIF